MLFRSGEAKCIGNYAGSFLAMNIAKSEGYAQVLWLDSIERKYIEEVGTMNVMFVINGEVLTPALSGSILPGITRDSAIKLLRDEGYTVTEKRITVDEVMKAAKDGSLTEMFGVGTAAIVSPVGTLGYKGEDVVINGNKVEPVRYSSTAAAQERPSEMAHRTRLWPRPASPQAKTPSWEVANLSLRATLPRPSRSTGS